MVSTMRFVTACGLLILATSAVAQPVPVGREGGPAQLPPRPALLGGHHGRRLGDLVGAARPARAHCRIGRTGRLRSRGRDAGTGRRRIRRQAGQQGGVVIGECAGYAAGLAGKRAPFSAMKP